MRNSRNELHNMTRSGLIIALLTDLAIAQNAIKKSVEDIHPVESTRRCQAFQEDIGKFMGGAFGLVTQAQSNVIIDAIQDTGKAMSHMVIHMEAADTSLANTQSGVLILNRFMHYLAHVTVETFDLPVCFGMVCSVDYLRHLQKF